MTSYTVIRISRSFDESEHLGDHLDKHDAGKALIYDWEETTGHSFPPDFIEQLVLWVEERENVGKGIVIEEPWDLSRWLILPREI